MNIVYTVLLALLLPFAYLVFMLSTTLDHLERVEHYLVNLMRVLNVQGEKMEHIDQEIMILENMQKEQSNKANNTNNISSRPRKRKLIHRVARFFRKGRS